MKPKYKIGTLVEIDGEGKDDYSYGRITAVIERADGCFYRIAGSNSDLQERQILSSFAEIKTRKPRQDKGAVRKPRKGAITAGTVKANIELSENEVAPAN